MLQKQRQYDIASLTYRDQYTGARHLTPSDRAEVPRPHQQGPTRGREHNRGSWDGGTDAHSESSTPVEGALGRPGEKLLVRPCRERAWV